KPRRGKTARELSSRARIRFRGGLRPASGGSPLNQQHRIEAVQSDAEQFRLLVQAVTDYAIYMLDAEGRVSSWNAGAQRIKGYLADEIMGAHFSQFYTPGDRKADEPA